MTDKEKIEAIKDEIECRIDTDCYNDNPREELESLLELIDSMQEEPKEKCKGCNNVKGCITCVDGSEYAHIEECNITGIKSKHATGKLKEFVDNISEEGLTKARKQLQEDSESDNLEQAIDTYLATYWCGEIEKQDWPFLKKMAIYFANWQKQQMMKESIDGEIQFGTVKVQKEDIKEAIKNLSEGDKVKLIIIKRD